MKNMILSALLLSAVLLCTGCAGQTGSSAADETSAATGQTDTAPETASLTDAPESADTPVTDAEALPILTDAPAVSEDAEKPVTDPPAQDDNGEASPFESVMIEGQFTATVRAKMPDYVSDEETVQAAVLQLFQDIPFFIRLTPEICDQIEVGETYVFHIPEQELTTEKTNLFDGSLLSPDAVIRSYATIDSVRAPQENEYGLDTWNVTYQPVS